MSPDSETIRSLDDVIRQNLIGIRDGYFFGLMVSTAIVGFGVVLEGPEIYHDVRNKFKQPGDRLDAGTWISLVAMLGWLLVVGGIGGEFVLDSLTSRADALIQTFDSSLLVDAQRRTAFALENAEFAKVLARRYESQIHDADARAQSAEAQVALANAASVKAVAKVAGAEARSEEASTKAEGFRLEIVSAKEAAAKAEQRAAEANLELARIRTPRSLTRVSELVSALHPFKGTEYVFVSVFQDEESIDLLRSIDDALTRAQWTRGKSVNGFPGVNIYGKEERNFYVPGGFTIGVQISADSPTPLLHLESTQLKDLPVYLQAAGTLNVGLAECLSPSQDNRVGKLVNVEIGSSTTIRIAVGRKP